MKRIYLSLLFVSILGSSSLFAQSCFIPAHNNATSGDNHYQPKICDQNMVDQFWDHFDMRRSEWDNGFGYYSVCDVDRPLCRTMSAMWMLAYSADDYARNTGDFSGNALRWGYPYTVSNTTRVAADCWKDSDGDGWAGWAFSDRIELYLGFFYSFDVPRRAGTLLHEARHQGGKSHNGGSTCPRAASCDTNWGYNGANMYEVLYLWWFAVDGTRTTSAMRDLARANARWVHNNAFNTNPGFSI